MTSCCWNSQTSVPMQCRPGVLHGLRPREPGLAARAPETSDQRCGHGPWAYHVSRRHPCKHPHRACSMLRVFGLALICRKACCSVSVTPCCEGCCTRAEAAQEPAAVRRGVLPTLRLPGSGGAVHAPRQPARHPGRHGQAVALQARGPLLQHRWSAPCNSSSISHYVLRLKAAWAMPPAAARLPALPLPALSS